MEAFVIVILAAAGLALAAMLLWCAAGAVRKLLRNDAPSPFLGMLERRGLTLVQAEEALGFHGLSLAAGQCTHCSERKACQRGLLADWLGAPVHCPNEALFRRAKGF